MNNNGPAFRLRYSEVREATMAEGAAQQMAWIRSLKSKDTEEAKPVDSDSS